jgi:hypothetical protein
MHPFSTALLSKDTRSSMLLLLLLNLLVHADHFVA